MTVQLQEQVCSIETYDICSKNKYTTIGDNSHLIDFRLIKKSHQKLMKTKRKINITLLMVI